MSDDDARVQAILEEWFARPEGGSSFDLEELCAETPELLPRVRRLLGRDARIQLHLAQGRPTPTIELDTELGGYRVIELIGSGGTGEVYRAHQRSLGREVALKVLRPDATSDEVRRIRFQREAEITAALDHPNIVPIYETDQDQGRLFLAMKLVDGRPLSSEDAERGPRDVARLGALVARGLHAAHEAGVTHRDVKPANILLEGSHPYVADFGLARMEAHLTMTRTGSAPGTLPYMAPEVLRGGPGAHDPGIDVYSLGATLYEVLHGKPPFHDDGLEALMRRILTHDAPPLRLDRGDRDLEVVVLRALEKDPKHRFRTAAEFADELERFAEGRPIHSRPAGVATRVVKLAQRHRVATGIVTAITFVTLALIGLLVLAKIEDRRDRARRSETIQQRMNDREFATAWPLLLALEQSEGPSMAPLRRRMTAWMELETLLDLVLANPRIQDPGYLSARLERLDHSPAEVAQSPEAALVRCLTHLYASRNDEVRRFVDDDRFQGRFPRCNAMLRAMLSGDAPESAVQPPDIDHTDADDLLFAAAILRHDERPVELLLRELHAAQIVSPGHRRLRLALAAAHMYDYDSARALEVLGWHDERDLPAVHVFRAQAHLASSRRDEAYREIMEAHRALQYYELPPLLALTVVELEYAMYFESSATFVARLHDAQRAYGEVGWFHVLRAYKETREGLGNAGAAFAEAVASVDHPWQVRRAELGILEVDYLAALAEGEVASSGLAAALLCRAGQLCEDAITRHDREIEANALLVQAELYRRTGDGIRSFAAVRSALAALPDDPAINHRYIWAVGERLMRLPIATNAHLDAATLELGGLAMDALERSRRFDVQEPDVPRFRGQQVENMLIWRAFLAIRLGEIDDAIHSGERALEILVGRDADPTSENAALLRWVGEFLRLDWTMPG